MDVLFELNLAVVQRLTCDCSQIQLVLNIAITRVETNSKSHAYKCNATARCHLITPSPQFASTRTIPSPAKVNGTSPHRYKHFHIQRRLPLASRATFASHLSITLFSSSNLNIIVRAQSGHILRCGTFVISGGT